MEATHRRMSTSNRWSAARVALYLLLVSSYTEAFSALSRGQRVRNSGKTIGRSWTSSDVGGIVQLPNRNARPTLHSCYSRNHLGMRLCSRIGGSADEDGGEVKSSLRLLDVLGYSCQPVVWLSLYYVSTTGGGLPAGPFGLVGALEGLSYLLMVGYVVNSLGASSLRPVESLSRLTLTAGLCTLGFLILQQGCVPNAKPILDYSAYLPVCDPDQTPGLFGGS